MPNGRFVSKTISTNGQLASVSLEADFLFGRCIPHLDREGRLAGSPKLVKAIAVPLRDELTVARVGACLAELAKHELVVWYVVAGQEYLMFPGFERHQQGLKKEREAESRIPSPRSPNATRVTLDQLPIWSGPIQEKVPLSEVKVSEGEISGSEELHTGLDLSTIPQGDRGPVVRAMLNQT